MQIDQSVFVFATIQTKRPLPMRRDYQALGCAVVGHPFAATTNKEQLLAGTDLRWPLTKSETGSECLQMSPEDQCRILPFIQFLFARNITFDSIDATVGLDLAKTILPCVVGDT
jgi:hypothetical protein